MREREREKETGKCVQFHIFWTPFFIFFFVRDPKQTHSLAFARNRNRRKEKKLIPQIARLPTGPSFLVTCGKNVLFVFRTILDMYTRVCVCFLKKRFLPLSLSLFFSPPFPIFFCLCSFSLSSLFVLYILFMYLSTSLSIPRKFSLVGVWRKHDLLTEWVFFLPLLLSSNWLLFCSSRHLPLFLSLHILGPNVVIPEARVFMFSFTLVHLEWGSGARRQTYNSLNFFCFILQCGYTFWKRG